MVSADHYRVLAADCDARAKNERVSTQRGEWEQLARAYRHLASQADRNQLNDIVYAPALFDDPHRSKGPV
jgi:hypothetical protein